MDTTFDLRAKQTLSLTPRLQQSVKLLQLSSQEFAQEINHALANNPFLEEEEPVEETDNASDLTADASTSFTAATDELAPVQSAEGDDHDGAVPGDADEQSDYATYEGDGMSSSYSSGRGGEDGESDLNDWVSQKPTLRQHLHGELSTYRLKERDRALAELIIDSLDENGYLHDDLDDLANVIEDPATNGTVDVAELQVALHLVQSLEPAGVAARNLRECLELQIKASNGKEAEHALALKIVRDHLDLLAKRDSIELRRALGCSTEALQAAHAVIRGLDPRPGAKFNQRTADYIVPDVIVRKVKGRWTTTINPAVMPRARLNSTYATMFQRGRCSDRAPLAQELQEARWLLRNAEQRFSTIQRVADAIVARQKTFFDYGEVALKPLILRQVAEELGIHESTVSRATGNKYMATPRGIFEFKHFFSRQLDTETGGTCSAAAVRALLKEMISAESDDAPLSDVSLTRMLADQGVVVARRTVSKYRGMMKVPPAELRRQV
ncbi:MAG TPA: RNA polymerase factor sigma-54 [Rhodocyclaceae bacterium]|nr:RNA polymerase factor sigma-54 [Rhodocyclaceae bacterium]